MVLTLSLGVAIGIIPVLGFTSLLCAAAAALFKLNLPVIQLVNWVVYPVQLALLVPFLRLGESLFGGHLPAVTVGGILGLIHNDLGRAIHILWLATVHALIAWALIGTAAVSLAYLVLVPLLRRILLRQGCAT